MQHSQIEPRQRKTVSNVHSAAKTFGGLGVTAKLVMNRPHVVVEPGIRKTKRFRGLVFGDRLLAAAAFPQRPAEVVSAFAGRCELQQLIECFDRLDRPLQVQQRVAQFVKCQIEP